MTLDVIEVPAAVLEALAGGRTDFVRLQLGARGDVVAELVLSVCDLLDEAPEEIEVDYGDCPDCQERQWDDDCGHCPACTRVAALADEVPDVDALSDVAEMKGFLKRFVSTAGDCEGGVD